MSCRQFSCYLYRIIAVTLSTALLFQASPVMAGPDPAVRMRVAAGASVSVQQPVADAEIATSIPRETPPPVQDPTIPADLVPPGQTQFLSRHPFTPRHSRLASPLSAASIALGPGWNLVSIPEEPLDTTPAVVLGSIAGKYDQVVTYNACDPADPWKVYDPDDPAASDLTAIDHRIGFWIHMTAAAILTVSGSKPVSTTIRLCEGWNLIGYPLKHALPVAGVLNTIAGKYTHVFAYDATRASGEPWDAYDVTTPAWANDLQLMEPGRGYWIYVIEETDLVIREPGPAPTLSFNGLQDGAEIRAPTAITATVSGQTSVTWTIEYQPKGETTWISFAQGDTATSPTVAGVLDPTTLLNGLYDVRVRATDLYGQNSSVTTTVQVTGEFKVGQVTLSFVDLSLPLAGIPIHLIRGYDSRDKRMGDFGVGWTLNLRQGVYKNNRKPGDGWIMERGGLFGGVPCFTSNATKRHLTEIRLSDQEYYVFSLGVNMYGFGSIIGGGCVGDAEFVQVAGQPGAQLTILDETSVFWGASGDQVTFNIDSERFGETYEPNAVRLTTPDGRKFDLSLTTGLQYVEDTNGNSLAINRNGVIHSNGTSVLFSRDGQGRITSIRDPLGNILRYGYDTAGNLVNFTNQVQQTTRYVYHAAIPHHLIKLIDPTGREISEFGYDASGRLTSSCDVNNHCSTLTHDLDTRTETVFDATGRHMIFSYDAQGNVTTATDALGNTTRFAYDGDRNLTQVTDATGHTTTYSYDSRGNLTAVIAPHAPDQPAADYTTTYSYDARDQLTALVLPTGAEYRLSYDSGGGLRTLRDEAGNLLISNTYGPRGELTQENDGFGVTTYDYDSAGNVTSSTDPLGEVTTLGYDTAGRLRSMTSEDGVTAVFAYDAAGRQTVADYGNGVTLQYSYTLGSNWTTLVGSTLGTVERRFTPTGKLAGWTTPEGATVNYGYDAAGRLLQETDALSNTTELGYDAAGRLTVVTDTLGTTTEYSYDAAGRLLRQTDALSHTVSFTYTADERLAALIDARNFTWNFSHTLTSTTMVDPLGRATTFVVSPHGLPQTVIYPDGATRRTTYLYTTPIQDAEDYPLSVVDEGGHERRYTYDAVGRLATATDLGGITTTYTYSDSFLIAVVDPISETMRYEYDGLGNMIAITYPNNAIKRFAYNSQNLPVTVTLPSGEQITSTYDNESRETARSSTLGDSTTFTWNKNDELAQVQDATGTTQYQYDELGNLTGIDYPGGARMRYDHDPLGRVSGVRAQAGPTAPEYRTVYEYDGNGNLVKVIDPLGAETALVYDAVNRLIERRLPNGIVTTYDYNERDQVTSIIHRDAAGAVLVSFTYNRNSLGEPERITREDGSYVELDYDSALRLTREAYHDGSGALREVITYTYDAVGNRLEHRDTVGTHTYTYEPGSQLVRVDAPGRAEVYAYDTDGRVATIARDGITHTLTYDADDRLLGIRDSSGNVLADYTYDGVGRRVRAGGAADARRFVTAPTLVEALESPHLVLDDTGDLVAAYVYAGDQPLMRFGPSGPVYYLADAMGSVATLTDGSGASVAEFVYDSFGNFRMATGTQVDGAPGAGGDFRFHGAWRETASGLHYFRLREYDSRTGRFLSRDPVEGDHYEPESFHPYRFANANPHLYRDPSGAFTLISISISFSVQDVLQGIRTVSAQAAKNYIKDKIGEVVSHLLVRFLSSFLSGVLPSDYGIGKVFDAFKNGPAAAGLEFEKIVRKAVCGLLDGSAYANYAWFEPQVGAGGKPYTDGFNCGGSFADGFLGKARPDYIFSEKAPTKLRKGGPKGWLIGDFKLSVNTMYRSYVSPAKQKSQFKAITSFAKRYQFAPVVLFVTLFPGKSFQQQKVVLKLASAGVIPIIVSIR